MARRNDHTKDELMDLVITATRSLVDNLGPGGVTARKIADEIGYTPGTLYIHFANLQDIFLHVNAVNLAGLEKQVSAAAETADSAFDAIMEMSFAYLHYAVTHPNRFALMFSSNVPHGVDAPAHLQRRVDALFALVSEQLTRVLPDVSSEDLPRLVRTLWGGVHGLVSLSVKDQLFTREWQADRRMVRELVERFLRAES